MTPEGAARNRRHSANLRGPTIGANPLRLAMVPLICEALRGYVQISGLRQAACAPTARIIQTFRCAKLHEARSRYRIIDMSPNL